MPVYRGWNAKVFKSGVEVGYCREVRVDIDHSLEYYYEAGNRLPKKTVEGPISIRGRLSKAWINNNYLSLLDNSQTLSTFELKVDVSNSTFILYLYNCKFSKGSIGVPQDGVLTEDYDFLAEDFGLVPSS